MLGPVRWLARRVVNASSSAPVTVRKTWTNRRHSSPWWRVIPAWGRPAADPGVHGDPGGHAGVDRAG